MKQTLGRTLPLILLASIMLVLFGRVVFGHYTFLRSDILNERFLPWNACSGTLSPDKTRGYFLDDIRANFWEKDFVVSSLRQGKLPLWLPLAGGGYPIEAFIGVSMNIFCIVSIALGSVRGHDIEPLLELLLAGIFLYLSLRSLRIGRFGSLIGGLAFMLNSFFAIYFSIDSIICPVLWMPLMFLTFNNAIQKRNNLFVVVAGLLLALALLACNLQSLAFIALIVAVWCAAQLIFAKRETSGREFHRIAIQLAVALAIGVLIASVHLIPILSGFLNSHRGPSRMTWNMLQLSLLPLVPIVSLLNSNLSWQLLKVTPHHGGALFSCYIGVIPFIFAIGAIWFSKTKEKMPMAILAILSIILAASPLVVFVYHRISIIYVFAMSVLAGLGAEVFTAREYKSSAIDKWIKWVYVVLVLAVISAIIPTVAATTFPGQLSRLAKYVYQSRQSYSFMAFQQAHVSRNIVELFRVRFGVMNPGMFMPLLILAGSILILVFFHRKRISVAAFKLLAISMVVLDLVFFALISFPIVDKKKYPVFPPNEAIEFLQSDHSLFRILRVQNLSTEYPIMPSGVTFPYQIPTLYGYPSYCPTAVADLNLSDLRLVGEEISNYPLINLQNVKYIVTDRRTCLDTERFRLVYDKEIKIFENLEVMPRAFLVFDFSVIGDERQQLKYIHSDAFDYRHSVVLEDDPDLPIAVSYSDSGSVEVIAYQNIDVNMTVTCSANAILVFGDTYYPGWKVYIDGNPGKLMRANYAMRAVCVPEGKHFVSFKYRPRRYSIPLVVSLASLAVCLGYLVTYLPAINKRKHR